MQKYMETETIIIIAGVTIVTIGGIIYYYYGDDIKNMLGYASKKEEFANVSKKKIRPINIKVDKFNEL